jgi:hypothetical protein
VGLDARLEPVKGRSDRKIAFEVLEGLLHRHQQQVMALQLGGVEERPLDAARITATLQAVSAMPRALVS